MSFWWERFATEVERLVDGAVAVSGISTRLESP
jgi:hypothetical protein